MSSFTRRIRASFIALVCFFLSVTPGRGADEPVGDELRQLRERLQRVEKDLERIQQQKPLDIPANVKDQRLVMLLDLPCLGEVNHNGPLASRYLAGKLLFVNLTPEPVVIKRDDVRLLVDGQAKPLKDVPQNLRYHTLQCGHQQLQMRSVKPVKEISVPVGGAESLWVFFPDIPQGSAVPKLEIGLQAGGKRHVLDVNAAQARQLGLTSERIGPRGCLGLVSIAGELNTVSLGSLVEEVDRLSALRVNRIVIHWAEGAAALDPQIAEWLQTAAVAAGKSEVGQSRFPAFPATIREFHLVAIPGQTRDEEAHGGTDEDGLAAAMQHAHKNLPTAIRMALRTAFESLPREELLQSIGSGNRLARAAALASGAGRLSSDKLPVILEYVENDDPVLQEAALAALQHFGDPEAIEKLVHYAKKNVEPLASRAIASLAASRFAPAHEALLQLLRNETPGAKKTIIAVLAQHPRPIWSDAIYEFVQDPRSGLNVEALRALQLVGHPKLTEVLREALQGGDAKLREQAFAMLVSRTDPESERMALDYTLERIREFPPDGEMLALLNRVKEPRAIPLLMAQLEKTTDKSAVIETLAQIGNQDIAESLLGKYETLQPHEKAKVLNALYRWKSPRFRDLAKEGLLASDNVLVKEAVQGLVEDGGGEAIQLLTQALDKAAQPHCWDSITKALGMLATPSARAALLKARDSGNADKRRYAIAAITAMRQRSPGFQYVYTAMKQGAEKKWTAALESFNMAIQLDSELPEAYAGRAECYVRQNKFSEAGKDYAKALELDPFHSPAITGVCTVMVIEGKFEAAIVRLEEARPKFSEDFLFAYNSACVYGRAVEHLGAHEEIADREKLSRRYTDNAIADLKRSIQMGFGEFEWMKQDPDLKALQNLPEFQKLHAKVKETEADGNAEGPAPAGDEEEAE